MFTMVSSSPRRRSLARATLSTRHAPSRARAVASSRFQPFSFPLESRPIDESPSVPTHTRARHARVRGILERSNARAHPTRATTARVSRLYLYELPHGVTQSGHEDLLEVRNHVYRHAA